jgi:hypothetical protein
VAFYLSLFLIILSGSTLIGKHPFNGVVIHIRNQSDFSQLAKPLGRLLVQNMALVIVTPFEFAAGGSLEPFAGATVILHLGHFMFLIPNLIS